ncbi:unnamed protein product [Oppiella nova]|uniref:Uncharacterized protein n=1 Tax=Oppiella nova TaxID=334625 RepID=A0A7R9MEJ4_9ACAR|nr:unnamed protein product [Oppiella nova]CAG2175797.1 unnamed protein product [Oppiella nova]
MVVWRVKYGYNVGVAVYTFDFNNEDYAAYPGANGLPVVGQKYAFTSYITTNMTVWKSMKCTGSNISHVQLRNLTFSTEVTCNGYHSWGTDFAYDILVDGNMYEVNTGTVTDGRCKGDVFFSSNAYVADDQYGCSGGKGSATFTIDYIYGHITGTKCPSTCTLDTGFIKLDPPISNN